MSLNVEVGVAQFLSWIGAFFKYSIGITITFDANVTCFVYLSVKKAHVTGIQSELAFKITEHVYKI